MCSILGVLNKKSSIDAALLKRMNNTLKHRGPDSSGVWIEENVGFAHNRLAIQDLSKTGHQPMVSKSGRYILCFNGEIYNHLDIRKKRLSTISFSGHSDTETLVELLEREILEKNTIQGALNELNGMFSFSLWDKVKKRLYLARDRMGIKPLYYYKIDSIFIFCSELKPFRVSGCDLAVSEDGLQTYFTYGHSCWPDTIFSDVHQVKPGYFITFDNNSIVEEKFWDNLSCKEDVPKNYREALKRLDWLVNDAVKLRLISDVPFGAFLSGGVDSSLIVSLMQKHHGSAINTFSVGFNEGSKDVYEGGKYSELRDARSVAREIGSIHHEIIPTPDDLKENIEKIVYHYDEPFGDPAAFPTYLVSKLAKEFVTVCASGEGADELFGGYRRYQANLWYHKHKFLAKMFSVGVHVSSALLPRMRRFRKIAEVYSKSGNAPGIYSVWLELGGNVVNTENILNQNYVTTWNEIGKNIEQYPLVVDQRTWLVDSYLKKLDNASMAFALEGRVPFLDHRIVGFANSLKYEWKYKQITKKIIKDIASSYIPLSIINKPKRGFSVPIDEWFRGDLKQFFKDILFSNESMYTRYPLNKNIVETLYNQHIMLERDNSYILWNIVMFILWDNNWNKNG